MKNCLLLILLVFGTARAFSQQDYFIYLQADNHQPFYVRMNNKVYSSTESGYLILPRLADSSYQLVIGFPANIFPEQHFTLSIDHKDAGYLVKNFGDKGWGLFNLQSLAVIMNNNTSAEKKSPELNVTKKTDAFSLLLANAVDDSAVLYTSPRRVQAATATATAPRPDIKPDTIAVVSKAPPVVDTQAVAVKETPPAKAAVTDSIPAVFNITPAAPIVKTNTLKVAELLTDTSYIAVYTDGADEKYDTIRVSIPLDKPGILIAEAPASGKKPVYDMPGTDSLKAAPQQTDTVQQKPVAIPEIADSGRILPLPVADTVKTLVKIDTAVAVKIPADSLQTPPKNFIPNSTCNNIAWDSDIDKLRVKMLAVKTDEDKIAAAKKLFKQKCVTVKQIRALNELFPTDEGKYKWFDAAYASASDAYNYPQLEELIKDSYYQTRFRAMIRK